MQRRYFTLDVFTAQRFAGNPLAVVLESDGLNEAGMQAVAREFNLPETVFMLSAQSAGHRARLRIFTPARELPFSGHPTVGTAVLLANLDGGADPRELILEEAVGPVLCMVQPGRDGGSARFDLPKIPERVGLVRDHANLATALGLAAEDLGCEGLAPEHWTAGNPMTLVPVRGLAAIRRAQPDAARWGAAFGPDDPPGAYLFCREVVDPANDFHARMFAPAMGVPEDPATGSAVAALAGLLAKDGRLADGEHAFAIEQGYEMGRPSLLHLGIEMRAGRLAGATVGGEAVIVSEGRIEA
jgi:trans-2,3-dihydro-3-hydroxyanthranilate isomerase